MAQVGPKEKDQPQQLALGVWRVGSGGTLELGRVLQVDGRAADLGHRHLSLASRGLRLAMLAEDVRTAPAVPLLGDVPGGAQALELLDLLRDLRVDAYHRRDLPRSLGGGGRIDYAQITSLTNILPDGAAAQLIGSTVNDLEMTR
jgi:hypothetical protein